MKKLLFIGPRFYDYHKIIKDGFENAGYQTDYFDDRPGTSFFVKVLGRINKRLLYFKTKKYFANIVEQSKIKKYDVVFVLYGQSMTIKMVKKLKKILNNSKFIFYMYDPISSMKDRIEFSKEFDYCYSFDFNDVKKYPWFKLVPLFYSFSELPKKEIKYDICYIGTIMPGKYTYVKNVLNDAKAFGLNVYCFMYIQSKLVWLFYKLTKKEFRNSKMKEFVYKRMSYDRNNEIMMQTKIILDCAKKGQSGLTVRTFETIAAEKKLITSNSTIVNYDFYNPCNIYFSDKKIDFTSDFFKTEYVSVSKEIKENYSLDNWVKKILSGVQ